MLGVIRRLLSYEIEGHNYTLVITVKYIRRNIWMTSLKFPLRFYNLQSKSLRWLVHTLLSIISLIILASLVNDFISIHFGSLLVVQLSVLEPSIASLLTELPMLTPSTKFLLLNLRTRPFSKRYSQKTCRQARPAMKANIMFNME